MFFSSTPYFVVIYGRWKTKAFSALHCGVHEMKEARQFEQRVL